MNFGNVLSQAVLRTKDVETMITFERIVWFHVMHSS